MMNAQHILDNSELLIKTDCKIINDILYERCKFDDKLFVKSDFVNTDTETYCLNDNNYVYRMFFSEDDYDYVVDSDLLLKLDSLFK